MPEDRKKEPEEIIPLKEAESTSSPTPQQFFTTPQEPTDSTYSLYRRLIPKNTPTIGRSIKLRDLFTISGAIVSDTTVTTITASGSSGSETDLASFVFFPNELHLGVTIRITASGVITDDGTRTCKLRMGSGLAATTEWNSMTSTAASASNAPWHLVWTGIVGTIGSSGEIEAQMQGKINNVNKDDANTSTVSVDTTGSITIALTADWDGSDANNSLSLRQWIVEVLR